MIFHAHNKSGSAFGLCPQPLTPPHASYRSDMLWSLGVKADNGSVVSCDSLPVQHDRSKPAGGSGVLRSREEGIHAELTKLERDIEGHALYTAVQELLGGCDIGLKQQ